MDKPRMLKREATASASYSTAGSSANCDTMTAACATELMNAATSFHKLHLKVTGVGSFAAHKALNELYDALPEHADTIAEGYQGATGEIPNYPADMPSYVCAPEMTTVKEAISYIEELHTKISKLQDTLTYSEIVNDLDTIKSTLNSAKYKLKFLS
jgi:DNA-binding ferritin-like protein